MVMEPSRERAVERQHSSSCIDCQEIDGADTCSCKPSKDAPPPPTFELWWCSWCGEPSIEWSDPCQECGEPVIRKLYVEAPK